MTEIRTVIREGQIIVSVPDSLPDGAEVLVQVTPIEEIESSVSPQRDDPEWDNSPEGIADWLQWYDSLQPLVLTEDELREQQVDREQRKAWN